VQHYYYSCRMMDEASRDQRLFCFSLLKQQVFSSISSIKGATLALFLTFLNDLFGSAVPRHCYEAMHLLLFSFKQTILVTCSFFSRVQVPAQDAGPALPCLCVSSSFVSVCQTRTVLPNVHLHRWNSCTCRNPASAVGRKRALSLRAEASSLSEAPKRGQLSPCGRTEALCCIEHSCCPGASPPLHPPREVSYPCSMPSRRTFRSARRWTRLTDLPTHEAKQQPLEWDT